MVTSWWSPTVTLTLKGMRSEHLRATGGPALTKVLLTDECVAQLAKLSLAMNQPHVHAAILVSSIFLLRVQSEAMGLEVGVARSAMPRYCRQVDTALSGLSHAKEALNPSTSGWPEGNTDHKAACWCVLAPAPPATLLELIQYVENPLWSSVPGGRDALDLLCITFSACQVLHDSSLLFCAEVSGTGLRLAERVLS